jgi:hypothetical protein
MSEEMDEVTGAAPVAGATCATCEHMHKNEDGTCGTDGCDCAPEVA